MHLAGISVMIANPRQTHQFAKSQSLTKTGNKDTKMLAFYAKMMAQRDDLATLLAMLPELGTISHKQLASLVGVAPHPKQSRETKFKGLCQAGRPEVRKALYMATLVATRFDEKIKTFYQRLRANGQPFKVAIVACMHKLLTILNARVGDELQSKLLYIKCLVLALCTKFLYCTLMGVEYGCYGLWVNYIPISPLLS